MSGTVVFGDVVQVQHVAGDVTVSHQRPPYRVQPFDPAAIALSIEEARAQPSRLLIERHQVVPFLGRTEELSRMRAWSQTSEPISVHLLYAGGGEGKSRLAREIAADRLGNGWTVWHARPRPDGLAGVSRVDLPSSGQVFVIADYADRWSPDGLFVLIANLYNLTLCKVGSTVRVLLLARTTGSWWAALQDRLDSEFSIAATAALLDRLGGRLPRAEVYRAAQRCFAEAMDVPDIDDEPAAIRLRGDAFGRVLELHMAALVDLDARIRNEAAPSGPHALSMYLLRRERAHWHAHQLRAGSPDTETMGRAVYVATLLGAVPRADARSALLRAGVVEVHVDRVIDGHRACYPSTDPRLVLEGLRPDRLGEDLVGLMTPGHSYDGGAEGRLSDDWVATAARALCEDAPAAQASTALITLVETARRWDHITTEVLKPLLADHPELAVRAGGGALLALAELDGLGCDVLAGIEALLPAKGHYALDVAAAAISTTLLRHRLSAAPDPVGRATLLANHAVRLSQAGHVSQAVKIADDVANILRALDDQEWTRNREPLATVLVNLGTQYTLAGRVTEAVTWAGEAVGAWRTLVRAEGTARQPGLAAALSGLGTSLSQVGRWSDALKVTTEAATLLHDLAQQDPDNFASDNAAVTCELSRILVQLGKPDEAVALANEAAWTMYELSLDNASTYMPMLLSTVNNLAAAFAQTGRTADAAGYLDGAVKHMRRLAKANPQRFDPELANMLVNLGTAMSASGSIKAGVAHLLEARTMLSRLAKVEPAPHLAALAGVHHNLSRRLQDTGRPNRALTEIREAVTIRRRLSRVNPRVHHPDLAASLARLDGLLVDRDGFEEAAVVVREELDVIRELVESDPDRWTARHVEVSTRLADRLWSANQRDDAVRAVDAAVAAARRLADADPIAGISAVARNMSRQAFFLGTMGRLEEMLACLRSALDARRSVESDNVAEIALDLTNMSVCLAQLERWDDALPPAREAVELLRAQTPSDPIIHARLLASALAALSEVLRHLGETREATKIAGQAADWQRYVGLGAQLLSVARPESPHP